jgi:drug/metabolite transporter (DMT)-like permease
MAEGARPGGLRNMPGRAIIYMLAASFLLTLLDAAVKWLARDYSPLQIGFLRYLVGLFIAAGIAHRAGGLKTLRTTRFAGHLLRSGLNLATMLAFYYALRLLPLADVIAISFTSPLFTTALSGPLLKEHVGIHRWAAVAIGFGGVLLVARPGAGGINPGVLLELFSCLCWSLTQVTSRQLSTTEPSHTMLFYYSAAVVVALGPAMPAVWIAPHGLDWLWFLICGILGGLGQFCINQALRYGEASMVAPLDYTSLVWAIMLGYAVFGDLPGWLILAGAAVIIVSSLYIARREGILRMKRVPLRDAKACADRD